MIEWASLFWSVLVTDNIMQYRHIYEVTDTKLLSDIGDTLSTSSTRYCRQILENEDRVTDRPYHNGVCCANPGRASGPPKILDSVGTF